jgi:hypothetical protein
MSKLIISVLSIGSVYEMYTRYLFKQINKIGIKDTDIEVWLEMVL